MIDIVNLLKNIINFGTLKSNNNENYFKERFYRNNDDLITNIKKEGLKGIVTFIDEKYNGRIDGYINFNRESTFIYNCLENKINVGSEVKIDIVRNSKTSPWYATKVEVISCSNSYETDDWDMNILNANKPYDKKLALPKKQVGMITDATLNRLTLNNEISFQQFDCGPNSFRPDKGDWVIVQFDHSICENKVVGITPLRYLDFEGNVSSFNGNFGYINKIIFFKKYITKIDNIYKGLKVYGTAIESVQGRYCNFRALTLFNKNKSNRKGFKLKLDVLGKTEHEFKSPESLGLNINTTLLDFGEQNINECVSKEIVIVNNNKFPVELTGISLSSETNTQFIINENINKLEIDSKKTKQISVKCSPQFLGLDTQQLLIEGLNKDSNYGNHDINNDNNNNGWKILIRLKVYVTDLVLSNASLRVKNDLSQKSLNLPPEIVNGIHLAAVAPIQLRTIKNFYPNKLKQYAVPVFLKTQVENKEDIMKIYPVLKQSLNPGNYFDKMNLLIHLEEINTKQEMKQFILENVRLIVNRSRRETFGIEVPGLSEGRPSLMVGDKVNATIHQSGNTCYIGSIEDIFRDFIFVRFHSSFESYYTNEECTVTFTHSRLSFRRMHLGIDVAHGILGDLLIFPPPEITEKKPSQCLRLSRCGRSEISAMNFAKEESTNRLKLKFYNRALNELQRVAVLRIVHGYSRPLPYILFGPPGTGKTVTLVESILQIYKNIPSSRLLVCAPSNSAADLICLRLDESGVVESGEMVRLNAYRRGILSEISDKEPIPARVLPYCKSIEKLSNVAMHRIIICTCITSGALYQLGLKSGHITHVFVDEAGQASEPEIMVSLGFICSSNGQIILAGDPMQLGPVVRSPFAKVLQESYLHRLLLSCNLYQKQNNIFPGSSDHFNPLVITQLLGNYRAHQSLLQLPSDMFYDSSLIPCVKRLRFVNWKWLPNPEVPLIFHGIRGKELRNPNCPSTYNPSEAVMVMRWIGRLLQDGDEMVKLEDSNISVITPYRAQVDCIRKLIRNCLQSVNLSKLKVASVEEFQGQENEVVIISTVRSSLDYNKNDGVHESIALVDTISSRLGFLSNKRRFNVAITRACSLLIVIGDPGLLQYDECWMRFIKYSRDNNAYIGSDF